MENLIYTQDSMFFERVQAIKNVDDVLPPPSPRQNGVCVEESQRKTPQVTSSSKRARSPLRTPQSAKRARQKASSYGQGTEDQDTPSKTNTDTNPDSMVNSNPQILTVLSFSPSCLYPLTY